MLLSLSWNVNVVFRSTQKRSDQKCSPVKLKMFEKTCHIYQQHSFLILQLIFSTCSYIYIQCMRWTLGFFQDGYIWALYGTKNSQAIIIRNWRWNDIECMDFKPSSKALIDDLALFATLMLETVKVRASFAWNFHKVVRDPCSTFHFKKSFQLEF